MLSLLQAQIQQGLLQSSGFSDYLWSNSHYTYCTSCSQWDSSFRAVEQLGTITEDKLNEICDAVNMSRFRPVEFTYMNKYWILFSNETPCIASVLDILQRKNNCYLYYQLPALIARKKQLQVHEANRELGDVSPLACANSKSSFLASLSEGMVCSFLFVDCSFLLA